MTHLDEQSPALLEDHLSAVAAPVGRIVSLCLDPQVPLYRLEGEAALSSAIHREVLGRLLVQPDHTAYAALAGGAVARLWLGPSQSPVQLLFSKVLQGCADGQERPAFAVAFADVPDGAPTHLVAQTRLRQLEGGQSGPRPERRPYANEPGLTMAG